MKGPDSVSQTIQCSSEKRISANAAQPINLLNGHPSQPEVISNAADFQAL
jgi:hypothetical protein